MTLPGRHCAAVYWRSSIESDVRATTAPVSARRSDGTAHANISLAADVIRGRTEWSGAWHGTKANCISSLLRLSLIWEDYGQWQPKRGIHPGRPSKHGRQWLAIAINALLCNRIHGLAEDCDNSIALALELPQLCASPIDICVLLQRSYKFIPWFKIENKSAMVHVIVWRQAIDRSNDDKDHWRMTASPKDNPVY